MNNLYIMIVKNLKLKIVFFFVFCVFSLSFADTPYVKPIFLDSIPHPQNHFTQGLFFDKNDLIETTGHYGESAIYRRTLTGVVLDSLCLENQYFGEGSTLIGNEIFFLTWKSHKAFILNSKPFKIKGEFSIPTEGWGLSYWGNALLMSNGTAELLQIGLGHFNIVGTIVVKDKNQPVKNLNELEVVGDTLYANIWTTALIAVINLPGGQVMKYLDFSQKVQDLQKKYPFIDVLNGIAFDGKNYWITGKNWPWIYKIKF